jgi:hypothetical protein
LVVYGQAKGLSRHGALIRLLSSSGRTGVRRQEMIHPGPLQVERQGVEIPGIDVDPAIIEQARKAKDPLSGFVAVPESRSRSSSG